MFAEVARHKLSLVIDMKTNSITRCLPSGKSKHTHTHTSPTHTHREGQQIACISCKLSKDMAGQLKYRLKCWPYLSLLVFCSLSTFLSFSLFLCLSVAALSFRHLLSAWQTAICCQLQLPSVWLRSFFIASFSALSLLFFLLLSSHISVLNSRHFARHSTVNILNHSLDLASLWSRAMLAWRQVAPQFISY